MFTVLSVVWQDLAEDLTKYVDLIEETVDLDQAEHHEYIIKPSFDENLQRKVTHRITGSL